MFSQTFSHFLCLLFPLLHFILIDQPETRMTHIYLVSTETKSHFFCQFKNGAILEPKLSDGKNGSLSFI